MYWYRASTDHNGGRCAGRSSISSISLVQRSLSVAYLHDQISGFNGCVTAQVLLLQAMTVSRQFVSHCPMAAILANLDDNGEMRVATPFGTV